MRGKSPFRGYLSAYNDGVTGSRDVVVFEFPDGTAKRILVDCGYFQEIKYRYLNYVDDMNPENIDAMIITHNHVDHTGLIPKFVHNGYRNKIYMTQITQELCPAFLQDCCQQQEENAEYMRQRYPEETYKFRPLFFKEDVEKATELFVGVPYRQTVEILPGIKLTFFENGHILGAGMVLLQCHCDGMQDINYFFTGDYRLNNCFYEVPPFPEWLKKLPLIMTHESTYGSTNSNEIKKCFRSNILMAFEKNMDIVIGAFAQGRSQEMLYFFKCLEDEGLIPKGYVVCVDGPLGNKTTRKYQSILSWYNPEKADFLPKCVEFVDPKKRANLPFDGRPKVIITTSGMLSNGPARFYVPIYLARENAMIHLAGYAAEETLARKLLEAKHADTIKIGNETIEKKCIVKSTREHTSHVTADEAIKFINQFENIIFVAITHGEENIRKTFACRVAEETSVDEVGIINRDNVYAFYQNATEDADYVDMRIKRMPAKLNTSFPVPHEQKRKDSGKQKKHSSHDMSYYQKKLERRRKRQDKKAEKKKEKNAARRSKKKRWKDEE